MFLLTKEPEAGRRALEVLLRGLDRRAMPIHAEAVGHHTLLWAGAQRNQNLHRFRDGFVVGRLDAAELPTAEPIDHDTVIIVPEALQRGALIRTGDACSVEPLGVTSVFRCGTSVSDRQLLLAGTHDLQPGPEGLALLAGIGYLPGDESSFREVSRVPFAHRLAVDAHQTKQIGELTLPRAKADTEMIERLISIVPTQVPHALALSGGFDSRFVLGILHQADADVRVVRFNDGETELIEAIADRLDLEVRHAGTFTDHDENETAARFTLLTDGQMPFGASQMGRLASHLGPRDCFHSGQFSDSIIKNAFKSAWKVPDPRGVYWDRLIDQSLLSGVPASQENLRHLSRREEIVPVVRAAVAYQRDYVDFPKRKQWANWVYYLNRGMRWAQAYYEDLTFEANPVFLLSDPQAQMLGIASGFWDNFNNDRTARLTAQLLPRLDVPYANGHGARPSGGPTAAVRKVQYEYLDRFRQRQAARASLDRNRKRHDDNLPMQTPSGWDDLFGVPMEVATTTGRFTVRRAATTTAQVLAFLDDVRAAAPTRPG